jgi:predicted enzyme related to lactoylglutathione lyase
MPRVVHFELPADDPERAVAFYTGVFGWKIDKYEGPVDYWLITTGEGEEPGIDGAIARRKDLPNVTNTVSVPSVDEFSQKIQDAGGQIVLPKMPIPGIGYMAYCKDPEGTVFGIMESDPSAA